MADVSGDELLTRAAGASRPTARIQFQAAFSPAEPKAWCELLRDIAAMANSGGGVIVFGVLRDGTPSGWKVAELLATPRSRISAMFADQAGESFDQFEIVEVRKARRTLAALRVYPRTGSPIVFATSAPVGDGEEPAFTPGTVYFRHGARSRPGTSKDLGRFIAREVDRQRRDWSRDIRKVVAAPKGSEVLVVKPRSLPSGAFARVRAEPLPGTTEVHLVDDPLAPAVARTDFDLTHPYRQTEVIRAFHARSHGRTISAYEILCVRRVHDVDSREEWFHRPKFGSPQYSEEFLTWLVAQARDDPEFFERAKVEYRVIRDSARS